MDPNLRLLTKEIKETPENNNSALLGKDICLTEHTFHVVGSCARSYLLALQVPIRRQWTFNLNQEDRNITNFF